eukprot:GHVT01037715.1.p1 GENE.GHVT01037715.1~~GHVT01037715.1.p1  ORF type:complete len:222 (+),score=21.59 GHVT01037715.1:959-1624(+)
MIATPNPLALEITPNTSNGYLRLLVGDIIALAINEAPTSTPRMTAIAPPTLAQHLYVHLGQSGANRRDVNLFEFPYLATHSTKSSRRRATTARASLVAAAAAASKFQGARGGGATPRGPSVHQQKEPEEEVRRFSSISRQMWVQPFCVASISPRMRLHKPEQLQMEIGGASDSSAPQPHEAHICRLPAAAVSYERPAGAKTEPSPLQIQVERPNNNRFAIS